MSAIFYNNIMITEYLLYDKRPKNTLNPAQGTF